MSELIEMNMLPPYQRPALVQGSLIVEYPTSLFSGQFRGNVRMGTFSSVDRDAIIQSASIGRYTSIGERALIGLPDYPTKTLSTHSFAWNERAAFCPCPEMDRLIAADVAVPSPQSAVSIGNDVRIGHGAVILQGTTIGDGAIVEAGAVVANDVLPYTIVAGNPAMQIRRRFSDEIIERLQRAQWWSYLLDRAILPNLNLSDVAAALDHIEDAIANNVLPVFHPELLTFERTTNGVSVHLDNPAASESVLPEMSNIKLVIWDLDETLWSGTLAETDDVCLFGQRVEYIRALNRRGVVSAICSKNDPNIARQKLVDFGLWDEFVFPRIALAPKGPAVQQLIADMQLRAENVLFVDDNVHNLREVKHLLPTISVIDATTAQCDQMLEAIVKRNENVRKDRISEYRMLEARHRDNEASALPQEDFLRSCDIRVAMVHRMDNFDFASRIEELINRSNQLNFTRSRVGPGAIADMVSDVLRYDCFSIFVWDKYGYHGLVGFAALEKEKDIIHLTFSCRVMHMGIENWVLGELQRLYPNLDISTVPVPEMRIDWIRKESFHDDAVRSKIYEHEFPAEVEAPKLRVMANCQSGAIVHFGGLSRLAMFDNAPQAFNPEQYFDRAFFLRYLLTGEYTDQHFPQMLVYGAFVDYANGYWPGVTEAELEDILYPEAVRRFCEFIENSGRTALVILSFENAPEHKMQRQFGVTPERLKHFNACWRRQAASSPNIEILDLDIIATEDEAFDVRHYSVELLKKIADHTRIWYDRESAVPFQLDADSSPCAA